jgi:thiamine pyrophosphokinase
MKRVLGVLAGTDMPLNQIGRWAESAEVILAADGGANALHQLGVSAHAAIGDFDSISPEARVLPETVVFNPDQDKSDCDKLLAYAVEQGYPAITLCNVEGDLLDHVLGTIHSSANAGLAVRLALRRGIGYILHANSAFTLPSFPGTRLSLVPLQTCEGVYLEGVYWKLSGQRLAPNERLSLSNRVTEPEIRVRLDSGIAALFLFSDEYAEPSW